MCTCQRDLAGPVFCCRTKLLSCKEAGVSFAPPHDDACTSVIMVWRQGMEANAGEVEKYLQSISCCTPTARTAWAPEVGRTAQVTLMTGTVKEQQEQYNLWTYSWSAIEQHIHNVFHVDVVLEDKETQPVAKLTGHQGPGW